MPSQKKPTAGKSVAKVVIGRERFAKISAVEGIKPSEAMRKRVAQFDRLGLSAVERRREIIKAHKKSEAVPCMMPLKTRIAIECGDLGIDFLINRSWLVITDRPMAR